MKNGCLSVSITPLKSELQVSLSTICGMGLWFEPLYIEDGMLLVDYRDSISPFYILKQ